MPRPLLVPSVSTPSFGSAWKNSADTDTSLSWVPQRNHPGGDTRSIPEECQELPKPYSHCHCQPPEGHFQLGSCELGKCQAAVERGWPRCNHLPQPCCARGAGLRECLLTVALAGAPYPWAWSRPPSLCYKHSMERSLRPEVPLCRGLPMVLFWVQPSNPVMLYTMIRLLVEAGMQLLSYQSLVVSDWEAWQGVGIFLLSTVRPGSST